MPLINVPRIHNNCDYCHSSAGGNYVSTLHDTETAEITRIAELTSSDGRSLLSCSKFSISCSSSSTSPERREARAMKYGGSSPTAVPAPCSHTTHTVI